MLRHFSALFLCLCFSIFVPAQQSSSVRPRPDQPSEKAPAELSSHLPVKQVVLYKNGVGYFEHTARVHGNQDLTIDFTTSQLNDVLKSLTVVDLDGGRISSVRYNSIAPFEERLKALHLHFWRTSDRSRVSQCFARCPRRGS